MADPRFPTVPRAPGVPPVSRNPLQVINDVTLLVADAEFLFSLFGPPQWGIFSSDGQQVLAPDSIFAVAFRNDWQISDFPIEGGGFDSYNKVASPFAIKVTMTKGGSDAERHDFLIDVRLVASTLGLYRIVTPDATYDSVNVEHWDFERRGSQGGGGATGIGLLTIDMWFTEVRVTGSATFQNTAQPSGADPINTGTVQPVQPGFSGAPKPVPVTVTPL